MHKHGLIGMVIVSSALVAQGETKFARPQVQLAPQKRAEAVLPPAVPSLQGAVPMRLAAEKAPGIEGGSAPRAPGELVFDTVDGVQWVAADGYKASFSASGTNFVPFLGSAASRNWPLAMHLVAARIAGEELGVAAKAPHREDRTVRFDHGSTVESFELRDHTIEHSFRFDVLPKRGELVLEIGIATELSVTQRDGGFDFTGPDGSLHYGRAVAIDADGDRVDVESRCDGESIRLVVPASFVAKAHLPLLIDPVIGSIGIADTRSKEIRSTDLCWTEVDGTFVMCFESVFSTADSDVYARALDATMTPTGSLLSIDLTSNSWRKPRIASLTYEHRHLVVAEMSVSNAAPFSVAGRTIDTSSAPTTGSQFLVVHQGVPNSNDGQCMNPDVGGDPAAPTVYFNVVFEREFSPTDHDIQMVLLDRDGARVGSFVTLDSSTAFEHHPVISKCDGTAPTGEQAWAVVYRRDSLATSQGHLRASLIEWDGTIRTFNNAVTFPITGTTPRFDGGYDVSTPTVSEAGSRYLVAETRADGPSAALRIHATVFDRNANLVVPTTLIQANERVLTWDCSEPAVDSDGCRYVLAWRNQFSATTPQDDDVLVRTWAVIGSTLVAQDGAAPGFSSDAEYGPAVVARHSGDGPAVRYGVAWGRDLGASQWRIQTALYEGRGFGGVTWRNTGCGNVGMITLGSPALGEHLQLQLWGTGVFFGVLAGLQASVPFPDCACTLGVNGQAFSGSIFDFTVPCNPSLVGGVVSFQPFAVGGGTCFSAVGLGNTADVTIE